MTAQFAGSRTLDDRRRRRLAQESKDQFPPPSQSRPASASEVEEAPTVSEGAASLISDVVAAESPIPARMWKVLCFGCVGLCSWFGLIAANLSEMQFDGIERLLSPRMGNAFRFFSTVSLLLSSQLAFTIYWYRSRSRKDFSGRYRVWAWAGIFWATCCVSVGLGMHAPLAELAYERWPLHTWQPQLLYWFVPFSIAALTVHQLLSLDMRHSRLSRRFWWTTLSIGGSTAGLRLGLDVWIPQVWRELVIPAMTTLWHFMICWSLLIHARFVVHVTNEAAPRGLSTFAIFKQAILRKTSRFRAKLAAMFLGDSETRAKRSAERQKRREESRETAALRKLEKAEARKAAAAERQAAIEKAKAERQEAKQLAALEKEEAATRKKAEREEAAARKKAEQAERSRLQAAEQEERRSRQAAEKADRTNSRNENASVSKSSEDAASVKQKQNSEAKSEPTESRKGNRVLGKNARIDVPHTPETHLDQQSSQTNMTRSHEIDDQDFDDDDDFGHMSKKARRKAMKRKQRQQS